MATRPWESVKKRELAGCDASKIPKSACNSRIFCKVVKIVLGVKATVFEWLGKDDYILELTPKLLHLAEPEPENHT
jgi:hypothetical protein